MKRTRLALSSLGGSLYSHRWEIAPYLLLAAIALAMRLWELGYRAISHDESLHAMYSWYLYQGQGYEHIPMMHGPFQFFGTAFNFILFGSSDFSARLLAALMGTALVVLPFFLRRQLGRWGSLAVAAMLAFSPTLLYFGRYARTDVYIAFWTLLLVIFIWRYFEERRPRYLYLGAATLSLSFCTKETTYIAVVIFAGFLLILAARELASRIGRRFDLKSMSPSADYLILLGTLSLPLFGPAVELIPGVDLGPGFVWPKVLTVALLFAIAAAVGLRWNWRRWLIGALIFYGIFALFYTTFGKAGFIQLSGFGSGIWGSMEYWIAQHEVARGGQPWYYYFALTSFYDFLPFILAAIGAIYFMVKRSLFSWFLIYWLAASLAIYSWSGEKMPWLSIHMILPAILLGGMFIGRLFSGVDWRRVRGIAPRAVALVVLLLLFSFTMKVGIQASYQRGDAPPQMLVYAGISADAPQIRDEIGRVAEERGEGREMKITVDSELTWPWVWYLRDYKSVDYSNLSAMDQPPQGTVLLLLKDHAQAAEPYLGKYGEGQEFHQLLWFPEEYREFNPLDSDSWRWWWDYFLHRHTQGPYWTSEAIAYFPLGAP